MQVALGCGAHYWGLLCLPRVLIIRSSKEMSSCSCCQESRCSADVFEEVTRKWMPNTEQNSFSYSKIPHLLCPGVRLPAPNISGNNVSCWEQCKHMPQSVSVSSPDAMMEDADKIHSWEKRLILVQTSKVQQIMVGRQNGRRHKQQSHYIHRKAIKEQGMLGLGYLSTVYTVQDLNLEHVSGVALYISVTLINMKPYKHVWKRNNFSQVYI